MQTDGLICVWKAPLRRIAGGSAEKKGSDLTQAVLSEGTLYAPVYHALKGGHTGPFEVPDHPAGSLKTCRRWTFIPLAESYSIFIHLLMCIFWGRDSKKHFYASHSSRGKDHKQSFVCWLSFYCDVLIWHCWLPEEQEVAQRAGGWIEEVACVCNYFSSYRQTRLICKSTT